MGDVPIPNELIYHKNTYSVRATQVHVPLPNELIYHKNTYSVKVTQTLCPLPKIVISEEGKLVTLLRKHLASHIDAFL